MTIPLEDYEDLLAHEKTCPFCIHSEHILHAIAEDEYASLSLAQAPYTENHLLIAPIRHRKALLDITHDEEESMWNLVRRGTKLLYTLGHHGVSVLLRDGDTVGKSEAHFHIHLIPDRVLETPGATIHRLVLSHDVFMQKTNAIKKLL